MDLVILAVRGSQVGATAHDALALVGYRSGSDDSERSGVRGHRSVVEGAERLTVGIASSRLTRITM
jgi:hypothetical protein